MTKRLTWEQHVEAVQEGRTGFPVVEVIWDDAKASAVIDWEDEPGTDLMPTLTVGYLVREDRKTVTIVSLVNTNSVGHALTIPRSCIVRRRTLV